MKYFHIWQRFHKAALDLAISRATLQGRLEEALYRLAMLRPDEFPQEMQEDFKSLRRAMDPTDPATPEGSIKQSTDAMSDEQATRLIHKIVTMYGRMSDFTFLEEHNLR